MFNRSRADTSDNPWVWVDWERECFLNFRDSERVVFLPNADVSQVCEECVRVSVGAPALDDWDDTTGLALFHDQQQALLLLELSRVRDKLVDFVRIPDDTRIDVLHIVPNVCFRVLTHTPCILASESIFLGLPRRHHQA